MKKYLLSILFLFMFCRLSYAASISVDAWNSADDVTVTHLETQRVTFQNAINSADGGLLQAGTVTSVKLDANANPENRWNEGFNDFVYTGLTISTSASLSSTTTSGTLYMNGVRVVKDATAHTYTASKHTYVDLSSNGTYTYSEVAINASAPETAANSLRLAKVSTDTSTVLSVTDMRVTGITLGAGSATSLIDADGDTKIQVEESADEDIIRFDTAGTERAIISSTGVGLKGSTSGTTTVTPAAIAGTTTLTLPAVTGTVWTSGAENVNSSQPSFLARKSGAQSNIALTSPVAITFDTEIFDLGADFASNTFTAPLTGKYQLSFLLTVLDIDTAATQYDFILTTSNRDYALNIDPTKFSADVGTFTFVLSVLADMDISDTASITFTQTGGTQQTDIGSAVTSFSGALLF